MLCFFRKVEQNFQKFSNEDTNTLDYFQMDTKIYILKNCYWQYSNSKLRNTFFQNLKIFDLQFTSLKINLFRNKNYKKKY